MNTPYARRLAAKAKAARSLSTNYTDILVEDLEGAVAENTSLAEQLAAAERQIEKMAAANANRSLAA